MVRYNKNVGSADIAAGTMQSLESVLAIEKRREICSVSGAGRISRWSVSVASLIFSRSRPIPSFPRRSMEYKDYICSGLLVGVH